MVLAFYPPHPPKYFVLGKTPFRNISLVSWLTLDLTKMAPLSHHCGRHFLENSIFGSCLGHFIAQIWPSEGVCGSKNDQKSLKIIQIHTKPTQTTPRMPSNHVNHFWENRFLAHFWPILEPRYGHLKAFLGPKMTKTRSKQP